jgi:hypothetical protein
MSSYHGADTAKVMQTLRRDAKRKQSRGTRGPNNSAVKEEEVVEAPISRHFGAEFGEKTVAMLLGNEARTEGRPSTTYQLRWQLKNGGVYLKTGYNGLHGEPATIVVTEAGFFELRIVDGKEAMVPPSFKIWTLTVLMMEKPVKFAVVFRYDDREKRMWVN